MGSFGPRNSSVSHKLLTPAFEHVAFPLGLGFVAGFVDIFGFMAWYGLLAAHSTGNLIFLAVDLARGQYALVMKALALPIFAVSIALSTWLIGGLAVRGRHPFVPAICVQAGLLGACLIAGLLLPPPHGPDDIAVIVAGSLGVAAMALQNTSMRLILNNLPPTTVMTGNLTGAVSEAVHWWSSYERVVLRGEPMAIARQAKLIGITIGAFTLGALAGGFGQVDLGYRSLLLPIFVLLGLLPFGRAALRAAAQGE